MLPLNKFFIITLFSQKQRFSFILYGSSYRKCDHRIRRGQPYQRKYERRGKSSYKKIISKYVFVKKNCPNIRFKLVVLHIYT